MDKNTQEARSDGDQPPRQDKEGSQTLDEMQDKDAGISAMVVKIATGFMKSQPLAK